MKIGIIGAGASGLMAAITAADRGAEVTLIEKKDRVGKKILATGNGKCNFTNNFLQEDDYYSQCGRVYSDYISQFDNSRAVSFFEKAGMLIKERNGYCYPRSEQASTVLDIFRCKLKEAGVRIYTESLPDKIRYKSGAFQVQLVNGTAFTFDRLILACGSFAGEKKQTEPNGYTYAKDFGHKLVPVVPALTQVRCKGREFKSIAGVRCEAKIELYEGNQKRTEERGELQLTDYGISGIPVFQLSRYVSYGIREKKDMSAVIDFLPEYSQEEWSALVSRKWEQSEGLTTEEFFLGFLNKKLNLMFLKLAGFSPEDPIYRYSKERVLQACLRMKHWKVSLEGTKPYENAQVCAGGVSMEEISLHMESKLQKGLFLAGEMLDVDGRCGGYNLQWAWTSGYLAGYYAASRC